MSNARAKKLTSRLLNTLASKLTCKTHAHSKNQGYDVFYAPLQCLRQLVLLCVLEKFACRLELVLRVLLDNDGVNSAHLPSLELLVGLPRLVVHLDFPNIESGLTLDFVFRSLDIGFNQLCAYIKVNYQFCFWLHTLL